MAIYKLPQNVIDERNKAIVLSIIGNFTYISGGIDTNKVDSETFLKKYGLSLADAR